MKMRIRTVAVALSSAVAPLLLLAGTLATAATAAHAQSPPSSFAACPQDTSLISNATIYVPGDLMVAAGDSLQAGDEIAFFTGEDVCAGHGTWNGDPLAITIYGSDAWSDFDGYEDQETLHLKVWDASEQSLHTTEGVYESCAGDDLPLCDEDGQYTADALYTLAGFSSALPVELTSFEATSEGGDVILTWQTASETGNAGFRIEQSNSPGNSPGNSQADGWTRVAFVESQAEGGSSTEPLTYQFRATGLDYGRHTFRLVQRDLGGSETPVGEKQHVEIGLPDAYALSGAYPNPFRERATVELAVREAQNVTVAVYDVLGRQVALLHEGPLEPNTPRQFTFKGASEASGLYFIRVTGRTFQAVSKAMLVR